ncbi:MAG: motility protein A [Alphaproteobacteria bacterium]
MTMPLDGLRGGRRDGVRRTPTTIRSVDSATVIGLGGGLVFLVAAILLGGSLRAFFDPAAVLIVVGGTAAVTTASFSLDEVARSTRVVSRAVVRSGPNLSEVAAHVMQIADFARRNGLLGLQGAPLDILRGEPFLHQGLSMIVDGSPDDEVEVILQREIQATSQRHAKAVGVLRRAAEVSPAMGLIGTLIGLVQMLSNLENPSTIGPSMAVALMTTFYGAVLANMILIPLASKLERNSQEESVVSQLYLLGVVSIGRQENPRRLEMLLNSVLPPQHRVKYFD